MRTWLEEHLSGSCGIICTFPLGERLRVAQQPRSASVAAGSILLLRNWRFTLKPCGFVNAGMSLCVNQSGIQKHTSLK